MTASVARDARVHGSLVTGLAGAIRTHVAPGMHLHFASTPSRSNAAIRELARAFVDTRPGFTLSSTGFHSMAHVLPMLGLADRLIACFFGDHYPAPRPNPLYGRIASAGVALEHWSLWSLVASFRAGAQGDRWAVNRSLRGTTLASELARRGAYRDVALPDGADAVALVAALRPDIAFVHAAAADEDGNVLMAGPLSEGLWSALAARRGAIVTVERIVPRAVTEAHRAAIALPPHRILAICEEPFGAHPQPLHSPAELAVPSYRDDFEHYERWRALTTDPAGFAAFFEPVLRGPDGGAAYRDAVGAAHLDELRVPERALQTRARAVEPAAPATAVDELIIAGARQLAARARAIGARVVIAGIGHAFFAARIAQLQLAAAGLVVRVMVETGLYDVDCGPSGHGYLLAYDNIAGARRLTAIDDILGVLVCGADNRCIAALGTAQIDRNGNLNTTQVGGEMLVGPGGACDIAALAEEAVVMTRLVPGRLVDTLGYITSRGDSVRSVVTDRCVLTRPGRDSADRDRAGWTVASLTASGAGSPGASTEQATRQATGQATGQATEQAIERAIAAIGRDCPWPLVPADDLAFAPPITRDEAHLLDVLDPTGTYRRRAG